MSLETKIVGSKLIDTVNFYVIEDDKAHLLNQREKF